MKKTLCFVASLAVASFAWADTIAPTSFTDTIAVGETTTVEKTVTITKEVTTAKVDVFFLVDTTGSMGGIISAIKTDLASIITTTSGFGDVAWGVGHYEDFPTSPWGSAGNVAWALDSAITTNSTNVTTAVGTLAAFGGNDGPESNFEGLAQMSNTAGWRAGSKRIAFWFGDNSAHDPGDTPGYPGPTQAATIAALTATGVEVHALNRSGSLTAGLNSQNEVTAIVTALNAVPTGTSTHQLYSGGAAGALSTIVQNAITTSFANYNTVSLDLSDAPAGLTASLVPGSYVGTYDRSIDRTFTFDLSFKGVTPGVYPFDVYATVDGFRVAKEADRITVTGDPAIPEPSMGVFGGLAMVLGFLGFRRRR